MSEAEICFCLCSGITDCCQHSNTHSCMCCEYCLLLDNNDELSSSLLSNNNDLAINYATSDIDKAKENARTTMN
jgi:hypothetical protein